MKRTLIATCTRFDQYMRGDSNALSTGPYMHSGKFTTLDQVLMF